MSGQRRMIRHRKFYHITNRTKSGLPFVPNKYLEMLIGGIIARAQELYSGVEINAILFMGNHYHIVLTVWGDPVHLSRFIGYFQSELSGIIHRLTGVSQESLWIGKYKHSELLTSNTVMEKLTYLYLNPVKANLVESVNDWEGFSSWHELTGGNERSYRWVSDSQVKRLPKAKFTDQQISALCTKIETKGRAYRIFSVNHFSWKKLFPETKSRSDEDLRKELFQGISLGEAKLKETRIKENKTVFGAAYLRYQSIYKYYKSTKFGKTPSSLSTCALATEIYRKVYRDFKDKCRIIYNRWKQGLCKLELPPGAFYPPIFPRASAFG
jgi:REP element-mobilizing transposase RayT